MAHLSHPEIYEYVQEVEATDWITQFFCCGVDTATLIIPLQAL